MAGWRINHDAADRKQARWIARQLQAEGYSPVSPACLARSGAGKMLKRQWAAAGVRRGIIVLSPDHPLAQAAQPEQAARAPVRKGRRLLVVRVRACELPEWLEKQTCIDLTGLDEKAAAVRLLECVRQALGQPKAAPTFNPGYRLVLVQSDLNLTVPDDREPLILVQPVVDFEAEGRYTLTEGRERPRRGRRRSGM